MLIDHIDPVTAEVTRVAVTYQVMPDLPEDDYAALKADIAEHGVLVPVETDEHGVLLDGHHRVRAWQELRAEGQELPPYPVTIRYGLSEAEKRNHARRLNVLRRQLDKGQRDDVIVSMRADGMTLQAIADTVGVSVDTVHRVTSNFPISESSPIVGKDGKARPAQYAPRSATLTGRAAELISAAPEAVQDVVRSYGVSDADTISELVRLHRQRRDTFTEVAASGFIQPGDEAEAVHIADGALAVKKALEDKAAVHRLLAADERAYPLTASNHISAADGYDGDEWYTPAQYVEAARRVMGGIDLDPASNAFANETVRAETFYTQADDGLDQPWFGRVFCNPPYSQPKIEQFTERLIAEYEAGNVGQAILLVNNSTDTDWFQALLARFPVCFTDGRVRFYRDSGEYFSTRQGQAFFYAGPNQDRFNAVFGAYGVIVRAVA